MHYSLFKLIKQLLIIKQQKKDFQQKLQDNKTALSLLDKLLQYLLKNLKMLIKLKILQKMQHHHKLLLMFKNKHQKLLNRHQLMQAIHHLIQADCLQVLLQKDSPSKKVSHFLTFLDQALTAESLNKTLNHTNQVKSNHLLNNK